MLFVVTSPLFQQAFIVSLRNLTTFLAMSLVFKLSISQEFGTIYAFYGIYPCRSKVLFPYFCFTEKCPSTLFNILSALLITPSHCLKSHKFHLRSFQLATSMPSADVVLGGNCLSHLPWPSVSALFSFLSSVLVFLHLNIYCGA